MHTLLDLFDTFAERDDKVACELRAYRTFLFSYADLDRLSREAAGMLAERGIGRGDRVVIWAPNGPWWVIAFFGVLLRGGVAVPVDFASGNERARWIAKQAGAKFACASRYKAGVDLGIVTVMVEELEGLLEGSRNFFATELGGSFGLPDFGTRVGLASARPRSASAAQFSFGETMLAPPAEGSDIGNSHSQGVKIGDPPRGETNFSREEGGGEVSGDDTALLIYTSGTTGEPKGVPLTHANLMANVEALRQHVEVNSSDVFLSVLPLSHSFEMMAGCLVPLSAGARIVYLKTIKPSAIFDALSTGTITVFASVPRLLLLLKGSIEQKFESIHLGRVLHVLKRCGRVFSLPARKKLFWFIQRKIGPRFRYFVSGGAALDLDTAHFWDDLGFTVLEGYGLTECSPVLTANQPGRVHLGTVGTPVPGVEVRIAADGEIEARGPNVFSGYERGLHGAITPTLGGGQFFWHREHAPACAFPSAKIASPFVTDDTFTEDGWFKTGDVGFIDKDGYLTIKTRKKDVIVTAAGMNVYPEDIEEILQKVKGVKECAVIGADRGHGEIVHAVVVLEDEYEAAKVIAEANKHLDSLQQITDWTVWEGELPKTSTMKVKKNEVKSMVGASHATPVQIEKGKTEIVKQTIGAIVRQDPSTIRDEDMLVSDLHITSLDRADLLSRLEQEFRLDLPEDAIGKDTTVGKLIKIVEQRKKFHARHHMRVWAFTKKMEFVRSVQCSLIVRPLMYWIGKPKVMGLENIIPLFQGGSDSGPQRSAFIVASNHVSYLDQPMTLAVLPSLLAARIATAAREDFFFDNSFSALQKIWGRVCFEFSTFVMGAFLLPQGGQVAESMKFMGALADKGVPILVYPEGERSRDGALLPFQPGLARMVQELRLSVVPVRIRGMERIMPRGSARIRRGCVSVSFGAPLRFARGASHQEILEKTKEAILAL